MRPPNLQQTHIRPYLAMVLLFFSVLWLAGCMKAKPTAVPQDVLRLHVIANSDSAEDQAVKLRVRDAVLEVVEAQSSARKTREYLLTHGEEIMTAAEQTLRKNGFSYDVQLMLGTFDFPDRSYGDRFYPAGEYEALRVVLGDGAGQNWWCVLFPPLCIITEDAEPVTSMEDLVFHSSIWDFFQSRREK